MVPGNYSFSATAGCNFLVGQNQKNRKVHWPEKSAKPSSDHDKNRKPKTPLEKTRKSRKTRKPQIFNKCESRKTEPKIGQIRKTENPYVTLKIPLFPRKYKKYIFFHSLLEINAPEKLTISESRRGTIIFYSKFISPINKNLII